MKIGFVGLGKMGSRMVEKLLEEGHEVVVWNRTAEKVSSIKYQVSSFPYKDKLKISTSVQDLVGQLTKPKIVWSMLPAGDATQEILDEISKYVEAGDIIIDGGNAHFSDTQKRYENFKSKNIRFLGIGVSGGLIAREAGYPMMVGGDKSAYDELKPILDSLAKPTLHHKGSGQAGGHEYFGEGGAGHFVKMVHNGIEYGYMQAIGEGFGVLEKAPYDLDLVKVSKLYEKGTLLSGFMIERATEALEKDPKLEKIEGLINASGEGEWTIAEAKKADVPIEVIETSFVFRKKSQIDKTISASFAARMVAALRNAFGGHTVKPKA